MPKKSEIEKREHMVVQKNDLIQKSRFVLSKQEHKLILYVMSKIKPKDNEFNEVTFSVSEFNKVCGIYNDGGGNYDHLKKTIQNIADKSLWLRVGEIETLFRWFTYVELHDNGMIKIRLHDALKPYLLQLEKHFTVYSLIYPLVMRSQYSIRLYEILKSYDNLGSWTFDAKQLQIMMGAESHKLYGDFKRRALVVAVQEINELTDLSVAMEEIKEGQKVVELCFTTQKKDTIGSFLRAHGKLEEGLNKMDVKEASVTKAFDELDFNKKKSPH